MKARRGGGNGKVRPMVNYHIMVKRKNRQLPSPITAKELGRRFRRALQQAGYESQSSVIDAIRLAFPGTTFGPSTLSAMIQGYKLPQIDRMLAIVLVLGLDIRIVFREAFDGYGDAITRQSHPLWFDREGLRASMRQERQGSDLKTGEPSRNPSTASSTSG